MAHGGMDIYEALYTTRMMRRMKSDPISLESQCRIVDSAIRAPSGGNTQRWHFLVVDDATLKRRIAQLYRASREREWADLTTGAVGQSPHESGARRAESLRRLKRSGDAFGDHFTDIPLLVFVFAIDDLAGANTYPAIWSSLLAARAEGIGGVMTTALRYEERAVCELLAVPSEEGWRMTAMLAFGYPRGRWGVAADRRPVQDVSSRNRWGDRFGAEVLKPLWPPDADGAIRFLPMATDRSGGGAMTTHRSRRVPPARRRARE